MRSRSQSVPALAVSVGLTAELAIPSCGELLCGHLPAQMAGDKGSKNAGGVAAQEMAVKEAVGPLRVTYGKTSIGVFNRYINAFGRGKPLPPPG